MDGHVWVACKAASDGAGFKLFPALLGNTSNTLIKLHTWSILKKNNGHTFHITKKQQQQVTHPLPGS